MSAAAFFGLTPGPQPENPGAPPKPFGSAADAWFWAWQMLEIRRDGGGIRFGTMGIRPCEPDDLVKVVDRLYRDGKLTLSDAHLLRIYGERGRAPNLDAPAERADVLPWQRVMRALEWPLVVKGIVSGRAGAVP